MRVVFPPCTAWRSLSISPAFRYTSRRREEDLGIDITPDTNLRYLRRLRGFLGDGGVLSLSAKDGLDSVFFVPLGVADRLLDGVWLLLLPPTGVLLRDALLALPADSTLRPRAMLVFFLIGEDVGSFGFLTLLLRRILGGPSVSISSPAFVRLGVSLPRLLPANLGPILAGVLYPIRCIWLL